jgi:AraC family transcriptional regulator, transcriptional activator of pobA
MPKPKDLPLSRMQKISRSGVFVKHFIQYGKTEMRPYAHRDDYYIVALLTDGTAAVEIDFERIGLKSGDILIVSPWQVHRKPKGERWCADGWMLAFSPEFLSEAESRALEEYSISPRPLSPGENTIKDIVALCSMLERNSGNESISAAIASAIKSIVLSVADKSGNGTTGRYMAITLRFRELLDSHLKEEKNPAAYASMLCISEVYLNEAVKGATGLSAGAYLRSRVIIQAKRLLVYTTMSAKEIAYSLGYENYPYFSRLFRKFAGVSPSGFAKNLK